MKRLHRDYAALVKNLDRTFDGQVTLLEDALAEDTPHLTVAIRPNEGKRWYGHL